MTTQTNAILRYLKTHKRGITSKDAIDLFGCTRLASVIFSLKKKGHNIECIRESVPTRYGRNVSVARYKLV